MIDAILDRCLDDIRGKRATVMDCLKKYPEYAEELKPLLETAVALAAAPDVKPSLAFKLKTRAQLAQLARPAPRRSVSLFPRFSFAAVAAIVLAILGLTAGLVYAAGDSLPDSPLYPIKRGTEEIQVLFATDPDSQARVHMMFAERRLSEAQALAGKPDNRALAERAINEYNNQVDASLAAVQSSPAPLVRELENRLTSQQEDLKTLKNKVSATALEKAIGDLEKAKEKLKVSPQPSGAPLVPTPTPTPAGPTRPPATPVIPPSGTKPPSTPLSIPPVTATPVLTPQIPLPPPTLAGATVVVPTLAPRPPTEVQHPKPTPHEPPVGIPPAPGLPTPLLP